MLKQKDFQNTVTFRVIDCPHCGQLFAITDEFMKRRRSDQAYFYCPSGHSMSYTRNTETELREQLEKQKKEIATAQFWRDQAEADAARYQEEASKAKRSLTAAKGKLTKFKNLVTAGVCPCCRRNFHNLQQHMKKQHPDFSTE